MNKRILIGALGLMCLSVEALPQPQTAKSIQTPTTASVVPESVFVPFRYYGSPGTTTYVPGQFNSWGPNTSGTISPGASSQMNYDAALGAWFKSYTFKLHDPADTRRSLGDSVFQYKFNVGGSNWISDPLNPERNAADNNNSVLRLRGLFWFQYYAHVSGGQITRLTVGLVHGTSDTVDHIGLTTGPDRNTPTGHVDVTSSYDATKRVVDHTLSAPIGENDFVRFTAYLTTGDSVVISKGGYAVVFASMPTGMRHGVTLPSSPTSDTVGFRLRVPVGNLVFLRLAPAGQSLAVGDPIVMKKNPTSNDWWIEEKLQPGTYDYLFEISNGPQVPDPWGRLHTGSASRFTVGPAGLSADDYIWGATSYTRPLQKDLVIYELNVAEFTGGALGRRGTFRDLINELSYFDSLGVNAIELMPVTDYGLVGPSGFSWGYDVSSYFAIEPAYGTARDLKELVDSAHVHGIAIILDVVFNHLNDPAPLWQLNPNTATNPYFKDPGGAYNEDGLVFFKDLDHWTPETQEHVYESIKMWIDEFRIDGFRYDYTQGIGWDIAHPDRGILGWANRIQSEYGGAIYQIAEHLPESPALVYYSGITGGWHDSFRDLIFDEARFRSTSLSAIEDQCLDLGAFPSNDTPALPSRYADRSEPVNYTIGHDEQSLIYEMTVYQGRPMDEALMRDKLYTVLMFTSLGVPMLWQGQETGESRGWGSDGQKLSYRPVDRSRLATPVGRSHMEFYQALIRHRVANPALRNGTLHRLARYESGGQKVLVWGLRDSTSLSSIMVVANFGAESATVTNVPWLATGTWYDLFWHQSIQVSTSSVAALTVPAYTALVYANRSNEELNIPTSVRPPHASDVPSAWSVEPNFPNPFNPSTVIRIHIPTSADVSVKVYSILGTEVATLARGMFAPGMHDLEWHGQDASGSDVSSGMYLIRLTSGSTVLTRKMLLVR